MSKSIKSLLKSPIDPNNDSFWAQLNQCIAFSKPENGEQNFVLDRRSIYNLKLIFGSVNRDNSKLSTLSHLLNSLKNSIKSEIGSEIGAIINSTVMEKNEWPSESAVSEFLIAVNRLCTGNVELKKVVFDEIIETFSERLIDGFEIHKGKEGILSSFFELLINLISQCPDNRSVAMNYLNESHFAKCLELIIACNDSLAQMLITEWLWRSLNSTTQKINKEKVFGKLNDDFNQISPKNFRESIHTFIMAVNKKNKSPISHIQFTNLKYNDIPVNISGWIDINPKTFAIWIIKKSLNLPDVVVLRIDMTYNAKINESKNQLIFSTKEIIGAFNEISCERPTSFLFIVKNLSKEDIRNFTEKSHNKNGKISINEKINTQTTLDKRRIYAKPKQFDEDAYEENENKTDFNEDFDYGKITQEKEIDIKNIEKKLNEFQRHAEESINNTEKMVTQEVNSIISKIIDNMRILKQMADQHKEITQVTLEENRGIADNVSKIEKEFKANHNETSQKREAISSSVKKDINEEKQRFLQETNSAFENNAIIGLSNNLASLRELMCGASF